MSIYYAFFQEDADLRKQVAKARQLAHAEIAFSYNHGAPGVDAVLVVVSETEPTLEGVTFSQVVEVPESEPAEVVVEDILRATPEVTAPVGTVESEETAKAQETDEDGQPEEDAGQDTGEEPRAQSPGKGSSRKKATA